MMKRNNLLILLLLFFVMVISCDSFNYVYLDEKTFFKQIKYLKDGYVKVVHMVDLSEKSGTNIPSIKWNIVKKTRFTGRNKISGELLDVIVDVINRNQRYSGSGYYPTYEIDVEYPTRSFFIFRSKSDISIIFDFKTPSIVSNGIWFAITKEESDFLKTKLDILLEMDG